MAHGRVLPIRLCASATAEELTGEKCQAKVCVCIYTHAQMNDVISIEINHEQSSISHGESDCTAPF